MCRLLDRRYAGTELGLVHAILDALDVIHALRIVAIVAVVVSCCGIGRVHASCPVALEGEPPVVDGVRAALADFGDDRASCVKLWVQCRAAGDELEIDLHDELGRSSLRLFGSARGAAAFIVSWSRRPLPERVAASEPTGSRDAPHPAPVASVTSLDAGRQDPPWQLELDAGGIVASGNHPYWAVTTVALVRRASIFRFGGELGVMTGGYLGNVVGEATARFGAVRRLSDRLMAFVDLTAGGTFNGAVTSIGADFGAAGLRTGIRAAVHVRLTAALALKFGAGVEVLRQLDYFGTFPDPMIDYVPCSHLEVGLRWVP